MTQASIVCGTCNQPAPRVGAQDGCDIYVCENNHLTRIPVVNERKESR